jgi:hypothetical protein
MEGNAVLLTRVWILGIACLCSSVRGQEVDAAFNYLQGSWGADLHSRQRGPFSIEIRGKQLRVADSYKCEWLTFRVLADALTNQNGKTLHRISITIPYLGRYEHACIGTPVMMWSFPVPPPKGPTGLDFLYAVVDFYTSRPNWESRDAAQSNGFARAGALQIYPPKASDDIIGTQPQY